MNILKVRHWAGGFGLAGFVVFLQKTIGLTAACGSAYRSDYDELVQYLPVLV